MCMHTHMYMHIHIHINIYVIIAKKKVEAMNWRESKEGYMGRVEGRKRENNIIIF